MRDVIIVLALALLGATWVIVDLIRQTKEQQIEADGKYADFEFVKRCIKSCVSLKQILNAYELILLFENKHGDEMLVNELTAVYHLQYDKITIP